MVDTAKKRIITIAGRPGSGKSTTARAVAAELGYQHFSSGDLFRALGREQGVDVLQANLSAEQNAAIDRAVDQRLRDIGKSENQIVIDSRMAWHWMPHSFKVFLDLDLMSAAERILNNVDNVRLANENIPRQPAAYAEMLKNRLASEARRYHKLYQVNPYDLHNYELVIDTSSFTVEQVRDLVIDGYHKWLAD